MTHRSVCDALEFTVCSRGWFCARNWRATGLYWVECVRKSVEWLRAVHFQLGKHQTRKEHVCCPSLLGFCRMPDVRRAWSFPQWQTHSHPALLWQEPFQLWSDASKHKVGAPPSPLLRIHRSASPHVCCANLHQPGCGVQNESCCWCSPKTCFQRAYLNSALLLAIGSLFSVLCFKMSLEQHTCFV